MKTFIYADKFFLNSGVKGAGYLDVTDGIFGAYTKEKPEGAEIIDQSGKWIAPGLVDTHIHGYKNHDVMDNDADGIKVMSEALLSCGVTSFLPTTLTSSKERLKDVAETIGKMYKEVDGAKIQGIYFEGPFFTEEHKGAQNPSYFGDPDLDTFHEWQEASGGLIKKIALAPERKGVKEFVKTVTDEGVVVSLGHSNATLITDCMMAGGMPDGNYNLGEFPVVVAEGTARLESGNLAGSILKLKEAIKNVVDWGIATPEQAVMMASYVPAVSCKIDDKCGMIAEGRAADFIVLETNMDLVATYLDGVERYHA